ncbi:hypothetical protein [Leptospira sp. GIMC2001]|uniref:hypothetical protein n=1 Tax=Leptospira sp. GIMC2001 TaxID=1513297 RepID=UPI00234B17AD|nr:hypothetical protein [Leptospira sp. GIMC2001]WCL48848.1 hypothetical protein O4O04_16300 [Leptospira sp. GIMC2001]
MAQRFYYDTNRFRNKLLIRFSIVLTIFVGFLVWNFLQIPSLDRKEFLFLFIPVAILIGLFIYRSFRAQLNLLTATSFELEGKVLIQYENSVKTLEHNLKGLETIHVDQFKSYPRIILEWQENALALTNLQEPQQLIEAIGKVSKAKVIRSEKAPLQEFKKFFIYISPSLFYLTTVLFVGEGRRIAFINWKTWFLFVNINLIIIALYYYRNESDSFNGQYQTKRKVLFVLFLLFAYQVITQFIPSWNGFLEN